MFAYPGPAIVLIIQIYFYWPYQFHGDTELNETII